MIVLMIIFDTYHKRVTENGKSIYAIIMALTKCRLLKISIFYSLDFKPNIFSRSIQKYLSRIS